VLKLLLRCVYHMLFTDTNTNTSAGAITSPAPTTDNTTTESTTTVPEEVLRRENENLHTLRIAGEVVHVLCSSISRCVHVCCALVLYLCCVTRRIIAAVKVSVH